MNFTDKELEGSAAQSADPGPESSLLNPDSLGDQAPPDRPKRNCGRTGPTSAAGRAQSARNSLKHGSCASTLILDCENIDDWHNLLDRWLSQYKPEDNSLAYDFVLKAAQAEWERIRCCRNYDDYRIKLGGKSPFNWTAEEVKMHDLHLRYKNGAQRTFQREYRLLQDHYKTHEPKPPKVKPASPPEPETTEPVTRIIASDPESPTGYTLAAEFPETDLPCPRPYEPSQKEKDGMIENQRK
jgi:hypothetical protein